ncbi:MAG: TolC family protein [Deltaproteobacteria bacterium]|nr:TolC family protein [Deltaproteobacteria bacterium]
MRLGRLASLALAAAVLLGLSPAAQAQGTRLNEADAVGEAMDHNPSLRASLYDYRQAHQSVLAEDSIYVPTWLFDAGVTHSESPRLADDSTTISKSDSVDLGTELRHTFPWGTAFSVRLEGSRSTSTSQLYPGSDDSVTTGPGYSLLGRVAVTQPLLRGFGRDVGEASLRQAVLARTAAERARDRAASEMLRDVLESYWELWYADRSLGIEQAAAGLANRRRDDAKREVVAGATAPVAVLPLETRAAELEQSVMMSETSGKQQSLSLGLLLGRDPAAADQLHAAATEVPAVPARDREAVMQAAVEQSQIVAQQKAQLALEQERANVAGEAERPRLDLEAYVQSQGLGNRDVPPAFEQFGTFDAFSAHVGLVFELPLSGSRRSAQRRSAEASVDATRERLHAAEQQAKAEAAIELVRLEQARRRVELASAMAEVATQNVDAQQKRHAQGDAITLVVHDAEDQLRRAQLSVTRARVDAVQANIRIDHLTGELLRRYGQLVPTEAPTRARRDSSALQRLGPF